MKSHVIISTALFLLNFSHIANAHESPIKTIEHPSALKEINIVLESHNTCHLDGGLKFDCEGQSNNIKGLPIDRAKQYLEAISDSFKVKTGTMELSVYLEDESIQKTACKFTYKELSSKRYTVLFDDNFNCSAMVVDVKKIESE